MGDIDQARVAAYLETGATAPTTADQGRALEDLICYVFEQVPGVSITFRNVMNTFATEEIDVALWNDPDQDGLHFLPNIILVECKNWSNPVSSAEVNWFDAKIRSRGLSFGFLVAARGITGDATQMSAAHSIVAGSLREGRRLLVVSAADLRGISNSSDLVMLVKKKLCELVLRGTVA